MFNIMFLHFQSSECIILLTGRKIQVFKVNMFALPHLPLKYGCISLCLRYSWICILPSLYAGYSHNFSSTYLDIFKKNNVYLQHLHKTIFIQNSYLRLGAHIWQSIYRCSQATHNAILRTRVIRLTV